MLENLRYKRVTVLGKSIPAMTIALLLIGGLASAGLLSYYGRITTTATVEQAITLEDGNAHCTNNECTSAFDVAGSETGYSDKSDIISHTTNDLDVKFENSCYPNCVGITITNMVELSVNGFSVSGTEFDPDHYKKTYYDYTGSLNDLNTVDYAFKVTGNTLGGDTLAPYVVIVSDDFPYGAAVYIIPDGTTYDSGDYYTGTVDGNSKFHVPGDTHGCAVQDYATGCTLDQIKGYYPSATVSKVSYALGAWPGSGTFSALMGLSKINGNQAVHKYLTMYGESTVPTIEKYDFSELITPGTYTLWTKIVLA